jgi:hypothetical protein
MELVIIKLDIKYFKLGAWPIMKNTDEGCLRKKNASNKRTQEGT